MKREKTAVILWVRSLQQKGYEWRIEKLFFLHRLITNENENLRFYTIFFIHKQCWWWLYLYVFDIATNFWLKSYQEMNKLVTKSSSFHPASTLKRNCSFKNGQEVKQFFKGVSWKRQDFEDHFTVPFKYFDGSSGWK